MATPKQRVTLDGWTFVRASAEYVNIYPPESNVAVDCINTYDYEAGRSTLPATVAALREAAQEWLALRTDRELGHYIEEAAFYAPRRAARA